MLKAAPRLPTIPACSQWEMVLLRTMWWPMFSLDQPFVKRALDRLDIAFGGVGRGVVPRVAIFAQRDAGTDGVADHIVLDDPALAPVRADQADLFRGGRRPGCCRLTQNKAADGDEINAGLLWIKHRLAHVDFNQALVWVGSPELRPDRRRVSVHLGEPVPRWGAVLQNLIACRSLSEPFVIEIDRAGMMNTPLGIEPIAVNYIAVWVEVAEKAVGKSNGPHIAFNGLPALDHFRSADLHTLAGRGLINNAICVGSTAARRCYALAVDSCVHGNDVTGYCNCRRS